jgi:glycosyltransferase involved in cell wall biosynthesis
MNDGSRTTRPAVLILNENESVPHDRRVWQEALSLVRAGYHVTVVCPRGEGSERQAFELKEDVEIHRFRPLAASGGAAGYALEYAWALVQITRQVWRLSRRRRVAVVHACNPPDVLLLAGLLPKLRGAALIFDHHDLVPELYLSRFGRGRDLLYRATLLLERMSFALADVVISTNESYRRVAIARGGKHSDDVFVVRNDPDLSRFRRGPPDARLRRGKAHLLAYAGVMGPQDGVDHALRALAVLRERRDDWHAIFAGDGDCFDQMQDLARELGLSSFVEFAGWLQDDELVTLLSTADVCIGPDPKSPLNDVSTMVKILEYMAVGRPIVSYDLEESRRSAAGSALYAPADDVEALAELIVQLLDDPELRARLGSTGRARTESRFSWERSEQALLAAYERALGGRQRVH